MNADVTTRVDLVLQLRDVAETVTVSGASPMVDTTAVLKQTVLETETLGRLPTGRDLWTAVRTVPGAVVASIGGGGYDVGGTGSLLQSVATVHGSQQIENRYYVDGQDVTAINSPGLANSYFDTSMFQEVNVQTGNAPAESQMGGVVYNMVTKTGTNVVHGSLFYTGTQHSLQANNVTPALRQQLLAAVPARSLQANPNLQPSAKILTFYDLEGSVSGPILRDRLWFTTSSNRKPLDQYRLGSYNPDGTQFVDDNLQWNYGFKLSWQVVAAEPAPLHLPDQPPDRVSSHHRRHRVLGKSRGGPADARLHVEHDEMDLGPVEPARPGDFGGRLLRADADPAPGRRPLAARTARRRDAIFSCRQYTDLPMMRVLAAAGADPQLPTKDGTTPLMAAAGVGWLATTSRRGIDLTANKAATPDSHEAERETLEAVKFALELGGDVNATNLARETALFGAVSRGFAPVVKFLAEKRARLDVQNKRGQTLLALTAPRTQTSGTPAAMLEATAAVLRDLGVKATDAPDPFSA